MSITLKTVPVGMFVVHLGVVIRYCGVKKSKLRVVLLFFVWMCDPVPVTNTDVRMVLQRWSGHIKCQPDIVACQA